MHGFTDEIDHSEPAEALKNPDSTGFYVLDV